MNLIDNIPARASFTENLWQIAWDAHSLSTLDTCPRKYQLSILEGWTPKNKSVHLIFGAGYHKALEIFEKTSGSFEHKLRAAIRAAVMETAEADGSEWRSDNPYKNLSTLLTTIVWYLDDFGHNDSYETVQVNGVPALELSFRFDFQDVVLCGHFDRLVKFQDDYFVVDRKTTKNQLGQNFFDGFNPHIQFTHYTYASQIVLPEPARGVIIDAAQVLVSGTRFARSFSMRNENDLREYELELRLNLNLAKQYHAHQYYPKRPASCSNYGGCPYRVVCTAPDFLRESTLQTHFERSWWDPIISRED